MSRRDIICAHMWASYKAEFVREYWNEKTGTTITEFVNKNPQTFLVYTDGRGKSAVFSFTENLDSKPTS